MEGVQGGETMVKERLWFAQKNFYPESSGLKYK